MTTWSTSSLDHIFNFANGDSIITSAEEHIDLCATFCRFFRDMFPAIPVIIKCLHKTGLLASQPWQFVKKQNNFL